MSNAKSAGMVELSYAKPASPITRVRLHALALLMCAGAFAVAGAYLLGIYAGFGTGVALLCAALTGIIWAAGAIAIMAGLTADYFPHDRLGGANVITILRAAGIAAMAGLLAAPNELAQGMGWALVAVAGVVLALDAVDGWAARRTGLMSRFGARLDVETDVAFALVTAALAVAAGKVGIWFLVLGLLRPAFLAATFIWPVLRAPLPPAQRRRIVAGAQMGAQVALLAPVLVPPASAVLGGVVLMVVLWSFTTDIRALLARRGQTA
ncbi:MAG: CDP-alcohol phosphatidyltransferase family protein [Rhodobacteraceae bacterium]|nr:CDP-alcohol phosphatidyltransferase family protein [Paracoccaceae bacterium]